MANYTLCDRKPYFKISVHKKHTGGELVSQLDSLNNSLTKIKNLASSGLSADAILETGGESLKAIETIGDIANTVTKGIVEKKIVNVSPNVEDTFTLPFPSSCSESYKQSFNANHELNLTDKKFQVMSDLISSSLNLVPLVGAGVGAGASHILDSLYSGLQSYAKRSGAIIDPNVMQVYVGPAPRNISLTFSFIPMNDKEVKNIIEAIRKLKELSLAESKKVFQNDLFPIRFLSSNRVVTTNFIGGENKNISTINDSFNSFIGNSKRGTSTLGYVIENVTTNIESLEAVGGFYYDGGFRKITLNIDLAELQPIYRHSWQGVKKPPNGNKQYYNMKDGDSATNLDLDTIIITAYSAASNGVIDSLKKMIQSGSASKNSGSSSGGSDKSPVTFTSTNPVEMARENVKLSKNAEVEGPNGEGLLAGIPGFDTIKDISDTSFNIITTAISSLAELYSESDSKMAYNERVNVSYSTDKDGKLADKPIKSFSLKSSRNKGKVKVLDTWVLPTPRVLSADTLQHNYSSEGIDNQARLEVLLSKAPKTLGSLFGRDTQFEKSAVNHRNSNSLSSMFVKGMGDMLTTIAKDVKDTVIKNIQRDGVTFNPFEIQVYNGTSLKAYALSYTILFRNEKHYDNVMRGIIALKYWMSPTTDGISGEKGSNLAEAILIRPANFTISFGNEYLNKLYDVKNRILDLVSIDTNYSDDTIFTEEGYPSHIQIQMNFIEHAPRRRRG